MSRDAELEEAFRKMLDMCSRENRSNTPDFILARYLINCLRSYEDASVRNSNWRTSDATGVIDER